MQLGAAEGEFPMEMHMDQVSFYQSEIAMKWCIALWIACLWACNPIHGVQVSGDLLHYKGDKLYFEICGQDTTITVALDSMGNFETIYR